MEASSAASIKPYYEDAKAGIVIYHGDCREVLASLEAGSVNCCVTSPPYWGLRDYVIPPSVWGSEKACEHEWGVRVPIVATCGLHRMPPNQTGGTKDYLSSRAESHGKFCQHCNAWAGNLGLEPTPELFVAHIVEVFAAVRRVLKDDGTLWLNLGDSYNAYNGGAGPSSSISAGAQTKERPQLPSGFVLRCKELKPKDLVGILWLCAFALRAAGWYLRSDIIWHKPNPMPESVTDRPTKSHEYIFLLSKNAKYYYDAEAVKETSKGHGSGNKTKRWGMNHTTDRANGNGAVERQSSIPWQPGQKRRNRRSVWTVATKPTPEAHFATFPPKLIEPCILAGCPEGGVVLDPFSGAGTTAMVCKDLGRRFVGAELNPEYIAIAERRIGRQEVLF